MKPFQLSPPASEELAAAVTWYETRRAGLSGDFYDAVVRTIELIRAHPEIGTLRAGRVAHRRFPVARFPYILGDRERENDIYVVAIAHTRRRPGYWKARS